MRGDKRTSTGYGFLAHGVGRGLHRQEYKRARRLFIAPPCHPKLGRRDAQEGRGRGAERDGAWGTAATHSRGDDGGGHGSQPDELHVTIGLGKAGRLLSFLGGRQVAQHAIARPIGPASRRRLA